MTGCRVVRWPRFLAVSAAVMWLGVWSGAGSILNSRVQESGAYHKSQTYDKDRNHKNTRRLFDEAGLMTSEEAGALEERIARYRRKAGMDVAIVAAYNGGSHTVREYVDGFYDQNDLGTGKKVSGVLLLTYMGSLGGYGGENYVSATGNTTRVPVNRRTEQIQDDVTYSLRDPDYAGTVAEFLKDVGYCVDRGIQRGQCNYDTEAGGISVYRSIRWYEGMFALLVSAGVMSSVRLGVRRRCSMEQIERERVNSLLAYRTDTKLAFGDSGDDPIRKFITPVLISGPTQNHLPGDSGRGSGRSSTHRFSSGRSRRGGGRRFWKNIKCALCTS